MTPLCRFCGSTGNRQPCAEGEDRCAECLRRRPDLARLFRLAGLEPPSSRALDRLTVRVERSKSGSIGAASVGCGGEPKEEAK